MCRIAFGLCLLILTCTAVWSGTLTHEQRDARETGIRLYNQYKAISATPFLETAAQAGDAEAQYYLGEALRKNNRFMTHESQKWLEAAANQGHIYAMIRLGRSGNDLCAVTGNCPSGSKSPGDWLRHAYQVALPLAEQGDPEAMFLMYKITLDTDWRAQAAEAGHALAQYGEAISIEQGAGFYLFRSRQQEIEKWIKASAEGGYPESMERYLAILAEREDWEGVRHWQHRIAETGYAPGIFELGMHLAHEPERYGHELDLVKGYGLLSLLLELDGGGNLRRFAQHIMPKVAAKMTPEEIEQALEFAEEWRATHPPVSYFPDKLSIY
ncbi:tetratricopeptide repeat protein [Halopseudomonas bauzanensis]|uniref:tetratricopeptide repeat protein n=1 Tax=Halopseudomonas bauzanensis TaxID=653930 RepID=UPI002557B984|nr:sel1 repeat family protein [Halopseudomonas bauzanensis]